MIMEGLRSTRMFKREVRRRRYQSAWIKGEGLAARECRLSDLSQAGAQIIIDAATDLPTRFTVALAPNALQQKSCEVMWRRGRIVGIRFVRRPWDTDYAVADMISPNSDPLIR